MNAWLMLVSRKGGYRVHSIHATEDHARSWAECKEKDGEDTAITEIEEDELLDLKEMIEKMEAKEKKP